MRITQLSTFNGFQKKLQNNRQELAKFQEQLSTGKRVVRPSDDNVAFGTSRQLKEALRKNEQYQSNIKTGLSHARTTQEALDGMVDVLIDFKSTAVNGSTDTLNASDRESLADKVATLKDKMIDFGNSEFNGTYVFAGTNSADAPFTEDGAATGDVADTSNAKALKAKVSDTTEIETTVTGKTLRNTSAGDLFGIMQDVEDALRANDRTAVGDSLEDVNATVDHVTGLASRLGNNINRLNFVDSQLESRSIEQEGEVSRLTDADYAETITNFRKLETSYEAALSVHSRISQMTLLNYM
jgi:flagellar hook-associated protein 3 FlgL